MIPSHPHGFRRALLAVVLCFPVLAQAQWQWRDAQGKLHISDRQPPADVRPEQILKRPPGVVPPPAPTVRYGHQETEKEAAAEPTEPTVNKKSADTKKPETATDRWKSLQENKQKSDTEQREKKEAEQRQARINEDCARMQRWVQTLESGVRIESTNTTGEREIYDESKRLSEISRARNDIKERCQKPATAAPSKPMPKPGVAAANPR